MARATLREGAYNGGSRMAAAWDTDRPAPAEPEPTGDEPAEPEPAEPAEPDEDEDQGDEDEPAEPAARRPVPALAQDGAGWVLGVLLWGWVVLPFIKGGPDRVKQTLMAKFLNKAPDGSELP